jgi:hypothetical protein
MKKTGSNDQIGRHIMHRQLFIFFSVAFLLNCSPTVKVEPPDKPITINLNVKIEHEIRVKVDRELEDVFSEDSGLF